MAHDRRSALMADGEQPPVAPAPRQNVTSPAPPPEEATTAISTRTDPPSAAPTAEAMNNTGKIALKPHHAPIAASNLKSP